MIKFLQLIRFPNLVMIALTQYLFKYFLITAYGYDIATNAFTFFCLVLATVCIAAGGNIINDIYDIETDRINKPNRVFIDSFIAKKNAFGLYLGSTTLGVLVGGYVSFMIEKPLNSFIFIGISILLYFYSFYFKKIAILGNSIVSLLVASSILILGLFDLTNFTKDNFFANGFIIGVLIAYSLFAFCINLIRELVKDSEDVNGDYNANMKTLPIILGRNRVNKIIAVLAGLLIIFILYIISRYMEGKIVTTIYALITLLLPLLYFIMKIWQAETKREYRMLSLLLKLIMLFGILSVVIFYYFDPIFKSSVLVP
ncbi:1,4-dihydroxy-2-naphthoate octaprenyltransferase [Kordia antarctica]|uniref:1,4-dihydroxy-2-naphthoate octaprenyltransferase n=1 Tax=Kordia antarctica TaxID=1218801 RepID=A0A7L4ZG51_9FLAO|nr:geranylgeranylglycerol-phosphate geranylgeranyltransferase [Kordia antarctica]QHI35693.1 1,4-dihydroxy-2-naphthoate octaprenyltransferase [Kordia antarctica]